MQPPAEIEEEYIPGEESRKRTLLTLQILKKGYEMDKAGKELFGDISKESDEFNEVLEKHVKPL